MQKRLTAATFTLVLVIGLGTGCRAMTGRSLGTNIDDKIITFQVKARASADNLRNLTWMDVDTKSGVVYLTGAAASDGQKQRAEALARSQAGVREVVNHLEVSGPVSASGQQPAASTR